MLKRYSFLTLGLASALMIGSALYIPSVSSAQSKQTTNQPAAKTPQEDGPVALTNRSNPSEKKEEIQTIPNYYFSLISAAQLNSKGEIAVVGRFPTEKGDGSGVFILKSDGKWTSVRNGDKATNLSYPLLGIQGINLGNSGELTFSGTIDGPPVSTIFSSPETADTQNMKSLGIFIKTAEGLMNLTQAGQEVPNMPSKFYGFGNLSRNSKGTIAFIGTYADPDGRGLFVIEDGKMKLIARSGQKTPAGTSTMYSEHFFPSAINERGEVAFFCHVSTGAAIFLKRPDGKVETVAVQGEQSPIEGGKFSGFANRAPVINNKGEVVFSGFVDGPNAGRALFFKAPGEPIKLIARSGDKITGMDATFSDFYMPSVNSRGDIVFVGTYGGRTRGVFLKTAKGIEKIALAEDLVPGQKRGTNNPVRFNNFLFPQINDNGDLVFIAQVFPANIGVYVRKNGGELEKLVQIGDKTPLAK